MRTMNGNPLDEAHQADCYLLEFTAPAGLSIMGIIEKIENAVPGIKLYNRGDREVHGYVNTSPNDDGTRFVQLCLYNFSCLDNSCPHDGSFRLLKSPILTPRDHTAILDAVGEVSEIQKPPDARWRTR